MLENLPEQVSAQAKAALEELLKGVSLYQAIPTAERDELPTIWRHGAARLMACMADDEKVESSSVIHHPPVLLLIPSLINRYYILDLAAERSFVRFLAKQGITTLLLDWGEPGERERNHDCAAYVTDHLTAALEFAHSTSGGPVMLGGYCMGGVMALALAQLQPEKVAGLALFAAPWDFHSKDIVAPRLDAAALKELEEWIDGLDAMPAAALQTLFYWSDPWLFQEKFRRFARLTPGGKAWQEFLELEQWVNDGVPLPKRVARDCLIDWGQRNALAESRWKVGGKTVDPKRVQCPAFVAIPTDDHIVPPGCAMPLAELLPDTTLCHPSAGHVGMMVGSRAKTELWEKFTQWYLSLRA